MKKTSLGVAFLLTAQSAGAMEWQTLGPRAMGMGGAYTAIAEGPITQYWNPAGLAESKGRYGFEIPIGAKAEFTGGVLKNANNLADLAGKYDQITAAQQSGTAGAVDADKVGAFYKALANISEMNQPGKGVLADISGGGGIRVGRFALSVLNYTEIGGSPFVDTVNVGLTGISYAAANTTLCGGADCTIAPANATNQASASSIASAIGASGYTAINSITGGALVGGGIDDETELGNALVNMATTNGMSPEQIASAAASISQNAAVVNPILQSAAAGNSYQNNQTNLTLRGASFTEMALGYGQALPWVPGLKLGGNFKLISGNIGYQRYQVLDKASGSSGGDALKDFKANTETTIKPAIDLGALWHLKSMLPVLPFNPRVGLVARNINNPKFKQPASARANGDTADYPLNPQYRAGVALSPFAFWHVAMDGDLSKNNTAVPGFQSQKVGLGTEINVFNRSWINIPLRAGLAKNMADSGSKLAYSGGFGLNFLHFVFDIGGSISSDRTEVKTGSGSSGSEKVPSNFSVAAQLGFVF
ncbi:MAG: conjugal transfer protein TraF [Elusimicrobia bacterium]|nr:conjugal transfer protein TraF [Elusimicrobiota bacterium]